jgi:hypothetical protein
MTMQSITLRSHVGVDGVLKLQVPVGIINADLEVMVVVQPILPTSAHKMPEDRGWPPGFFEQTFGCLQDAPLVREPQGEYEVRDELQ